MARRELVTNRRNALTRSSVLTQSRTLYPLTIGDVRARSAMSRSRGPLHGTKTGVYRWTLTTRPSFENSICSPTRSR